ncbi:O-succinylhomoserine sulfhydrylase [Xanthobacter agilis]|uniref:O-succinylhomoserine sulfhydrylase n=1 Tax=Xanthobacter agilis TaxID=47492 RepID=A0ABU0LCN0_XANAG|nr:O-succinylhomoserine sulfhydrylase [Xanthobacter agilis]MDQ0504907.1 O-succinylhomoserine sulfhydrylase [Xanthobacter agilis]
MSSASETRTPRPTAFTPRDPQTLHPETRLVHAGTTRSPFGETSEALFLTQGFVYDSAAACEARFKGEDPGFVYSRYANPTTAMFEERMALIEGAEVARATASGMAAVNAALLCQVKAGDHVLAARALFGSSRWILEELLPRFGVDVTLVDGSDLGAWEQAIRPNTRVCLLESPTNPTLDIIDIAAVAKIAHSVGACLVVDNVFATPLLQHPLALGADVVVYSTTKHVDGQGRCLGGMVLCSRQFLDDHLQVFLRQTGPSISPFNAWVMLKGLETLALRVDRMQASAARLADVLAGAKGVAKVLYPFRADHPQAALARRQMSGGGTLITLVVDGGKEGAFRFMDALRVIRISNNLGDAKSLITHPATTTHQRFTPEARAEMGISDGLLRLSVGLEHPDDLEADLAQALAAI